MKGRFSTRGLLYDFVTVHMEAPQQHVMHLVARYAAILGIAPPIVRLAASHSGPCYDPLFNRIEVDAPTLALPEPLLCLVLAHEVGHATQRTALLFDLTKTVFGVTALIAGPCIMFAAWPGEDLWRISIPGALFAILMALLFPTWRARTVQRAKALELDADAKAATLCGARIALEAMEIMAKRGRVDAIRLNVMRERCAHAEDAKEAKSTCR
ncbi:hypothetical protein [Caballeronia grimmiae]|uniref:hypothetical protein n=1 Tax=Caballeronia grimmiae TaxID=1071679 RepID=UPI0038BD4F67